MTMALATLDTSVLSGGHRATAGSAHVSPTTINVGGPAEELKVVAPVSPVDGKPGHKQLDGIPITRSPSSLPLSPPSDGPELSASAEMDVVVDDEIKLPLSAEQAAMEVVDVEEKTEIDEKQATVVEESFEGPVASVIRPAIDTKMDVDAFSGVSVFSQSPPAPSPPILTAAEFKACTQLINELMKHGSAWPFQMPVDPVAAGAPDYFDVIKQPMDLSTVNSKLNTRQYHDVQQFADDIQLMLNNCFIYNPHNNHVHQLGKSLDSFFSLQLSKHFPTITTTSLSHKSSAEYPAEAALASAPQQRRLSKRHVRAPKIFEPEIIPVKKAKSSPATRRLSTSSSIAQMKEEYESSEEEEEDEDDDVNHQITTLATCLQSINQQLALLTEKKKGKRKRSSVSAASIAAAATVPAAKKRRPSSSKAAARRASMATSDLGIDADGAPSSAPSKRSRTKSTGDKHCEYCGTSETPMWRRGPSGCGTLCNKCGVKWRNGKIMGGGGAVTPAGAVAAAGADAGVSVKADLDGGAQPLDGESLAAAVVTSSTTPKPPSHFSSFRSIKSKKESQASSTTPSTTVATMKAKRPRASTSSRAGRPPKASASTLKKRRQSASAPKSKSITYEQKSELSVLIGSLGYSDMTNVVEIIRSGLPHLRDTEEEIELDIDSIDDGTLCTLYDFVKHATMKTAGGAAAATPANTAVRGLAGSDDDGDDSDDASSSDSD